MFNETGVRSRVKNALCAGCRTCCLPEDVGSLVLRNVGVLPQHCTVSTQMTSTWNVKVYFHLYRKTTHQDRSQQHKLTSF